MTQGQPNDHTVTCQTIPVFKPRQESLPLGEMGIIGSYLGGMRRGGIYLLAGPPGSRKSGLALQIAIDLTLSQVNSLFLLTEESPERLRERSLMMISDWSSHDLSALLNYICVEPAVPAMQHLPKYVCDELLTTRGKWRGSEISLVVIDSAQGHGLSAAATRGYAGLIEATHLLAGAGMTVLIVSHMTKGGEVAGPAALEHSVDAAMVLKPTATGRALFVKKNRFGSANSADPLLLELDDVTLRLAPVKHRNSRIAVARTYGGEADGLADV